MAELPTYTPLKGGQATCGTKICPLVVETFIFLTWVGLEVTNVILHVLWGITGMFKACLCVCVPKKEKRVVIVGASVGGLATQRGLSGLRGVKVTVIDFKKHVHARSRHTCPHHAPRSLSHLTMPQVL